jgi:hypothetical protein
MGGPEEKQEHAATSVIHMGIAVVPPLGTSQINQSPLLRQTRRTTNNDFPNHAFHL